jgi:hypothetical protein
LRWGLKQQPVGLGAQAQQLPQSEPSVPALPWASPISRPVPAQAQTFALAVASLAQAGAAALR